MQNIKEAINAYEKYLTSGSQDDLDASTKLYLGLKEFEKRIFTAVRHLKGDTASELDQSHKDFKMALSLAKGLLK